MQVLVTSGLNLALVLELIWSLVPLELKRWIVSTTSIPHAVATFTPFPASSSSCALMNCGCDAGIVGALAGFGDLPSHQAVVGSHIHSSDESDCLGTRSAFNGAVDVRQVREK